MGLGCYRNKGTTRTVVVGSDFDISLGSVIFGAGAGTGRLYLWLKVGWDEVGYGRVRRPKSGTFNSPITKHAAFANFYF